MTYVLLALSYLLGATPTSYWVCRSVRGLDLRAHGSGNLGATNVYRVVGWRWALLVVTVDVAKGFASARVFPELTGASLEWALLYGGAAVVGHVFSPWVGFRGGKGVATGAGALLAVAPWAIAGAVAIWLAVLLATRYVSLASLSGAVALPGLTAATATSHAVALVSFTGALACFVVWTHRGNVRRLLRGEESRLGQGVR